MGFAVGDKIRVEGVGSGFDGEHTVQEAAATIITVLTDTRGTGAEAIVGTWSVVEPL